MSILTNPAASVLVTALAPSPGLATTLTLTPPSPNQVRAGQSTNPYIVGISPVGGSLQTCSIVVTPVGKDDTGTVITGLTFTPATVTLDDTHKVVSFVANIPVGYTGNVNVTVTHTETGTPSGM